jgi:hypothetical protein
MLGTRPQRSISLVRLTLFVLPGFLLRTPALAQDDFGLNLTRPHLSVTVGGTPNADLADVPGSYGSRTLATSFAFPIVGASPVEGSALPFRLLGHVEARVANGEIGFLRGTRTLYSATGGVSALFAQKSGDTFLASLGVGLAEDETTLGAPRARVSGLFLEMHRASPSFSLGYGLSYSYLLGAGRLLPAFGVSWQPEPQWRVRLLLPLTASVRYHASDRWTLGFRAGPDGNRFGVANGGSFPGQADSLRIRVRGVKAGLEAATRLDRLVSLRFEGGIAARRTLAIDDGGVQLLSTKVANAPYASLTLGFAFGARSRAAWDADR